MQALYGVKLTMPYHSTSLSQWVARLPVPAAAQHENVLPSEMPATLVPSAPVFVAQSGPAFDRAARVAKLAAIPVMGRFLAALASSPTASQTAAEAEAKAAAALEHCRLLADHLALVQQQLRLRDAAREHESAQQRAQMAHLQAQIDHVTRDGRTTVLGHNCTHAELVKLVATNAAEFAKLAATTTAVKIEAADQLQRHETWRRARDAEHQEHLSQIIERVEALARAHDGEVNLQELARLRSAVEHLATRPQKVGEPRDATEIAMRLGRLDAQYDQLSRVATELEALRIKVSAELRDLQGTNATLQKLEHDAFGEALPTGEIAQFYTDLENRFRGSREEIKNRFRAYVGALRECGAGTSDRPILDVACGRGEFVELLRDEQWHGTRWSVIGIDNNPAQLAECQRYRLPVEQADALAYLRAQPAESLGAVTAMQFVEHVPIATLIALVKEIFRVLKPGGLLIFETPNPENMLVATMTFHYDPTHKKPLPPDFLQFVVDRGGFPSARIERLNGADAGQFLPELFSAANQRLNHMLYGPRDYAVIGKKPE